MKGKISVLIVVGQLEIGGTEHHLLKIASRLDPRRFQISVYTLRRGGRLEPRFEEVGVEVLGPPHYARRPQRIVTTICHLISTLWCKRPNVVHYFLPEAYVIGGLCGFFAPRSIQLMSRRSLNYYQRGRTFIKFIERLLHSRMDAVLANSKAVVKDLLEEGVESSRIGLIYNGVEVKVNRSDFEKLEIKDQLGIGHDVFVFITVANLIPYKGHEDIIGALTRIKAELPEDWLYLMLGEDRGFGQRLKELARDAGVDQNVRWLGGQSNVEDYLHIADLSILASHEEGFSNAVLEAMAAGLPSIVTAVGGNADVLTNGENGFLVPSKNTHCLSEAIRELCKDPDLRTKMGNNAREHVLRHYDLESCVSAYQSLYGNLTVRANRSVQELIKQEQE